MLERASAIYDKSNKTIRDQLRTPECLPSQWLILPIRTGDDIYHIWRMVMNARVDGWPMPQVPLAWVTRSDMIRQPMPTCSIWGT